MLCVVVFEEHIMPSVLCDLLPFCSTFCKMELQKHLVVERKSAVTVEGI